jgi:hypothetical protein
MTVLRALHWSATRFDNLVCAFQRVFILTERRFCKLLIGVMFIGLLCIACIPALRESRVAVRISCLLIAGVVANALYIRFRVAVKRKFGILSTLPGQMLFWTMIAFPAWFLLLGAILDFEERRSSTFQEAVRELHESEVARGVFGDSIYIGWPVEGQSSWGGSTGRKVLVMAVEGNRTSGWMRAVATKADGVWKTEELVITSRDGKTHEDILTRSSIQHRASP